MTDPNHKEPAPSGSPILEAALQTVSGQPLPKPGTLEKAAADYFAFKRFELDDFLDDTIH